jgi:hypothetical protein
VKEGPESAVAVPVEAGRAAVGGIDVAAGSGVDAAGVTGAQALSRKRTIPQGFQDRKRECLRVRRFMIVVTCSLSAFVFYRKVVYPLMPVMEMERMI